MNPKVMHSAAFLGLSSMLLIQSCAEIQVKTKLLRIATGIPNFADHRYYEHLESVDSVEVSIFSSEIDYKLHQNALFSGFTNKHGLLLIPDFTDFDSLWFYAAKENLNNLRFGDTMGMSPWLEEINPYNEIRNFNIRLSTTPVKIRFIVISEMGSHSDLRVQLYLSESDFINKTPPEKSLQSLNNMYGNWSLYDSEVQYLKVGSHFSKLTGVDGSVTFDNLEPRPYWIRIYNNENELVITPNNIVAPSSNPNIINQIQINAK